MGFLSNIFNTVLYQPLFNALILIYEYLPWQSFGLAVILLTVAIRLIIYPSSVQSIKSQKALSSLQPEMQKIKEKYKDDKEKQAQATMELYKKNKINPISGCLPMLIQLPLLIAMYRVFWKGLSPEQMTNLYGFVAHPGVINTSFLWVADLGQPAFLEVGGEKHLIIANVVLIVLAGIAQFVQSKMLTTKPQPGAKKGKDQMAQFSNMMQKQMVYFFPVLIVFILWSLPSALALYLIISSLFSIAQQHFILKKTVPA